MNIEWLLEGNGRIFRKDPITLGPNSSGAEIAAVASTLPMADQRVLKAIVGKILEERGL